MATENPQSRSPSTQSLEQGMVFNDQRGGERYTIALVDDSTVVLEADSGGRIFEPREQFDDARGNRWDHLTQQSVQTPTDPSTNPQNDDDETDTIDPAIALQSAIQIKRQSEQQNSAGSTLATPVLEQIEQSLDSHCLLPVKFTTVDGIGDATADNLKENGVERRLDVRLASDDYLTDVRGVGQQTLDNLRQKVDMDN